MENPITSKEIFTSFSTANTFTAEMLKTIFNIGFDLRSGKRIDYQSYDEKFTSIIIELITSSEEFCRNISKKILFIASDKDLTGYSARSIGSLMYDKYEVNSTDVSLKLNGGFDPIYTKLIIKKTKDSPIRITDYITYNSANRPLNQSGYIVDIGDPYNEVLINTYLNIAYDSGNFIHIPKLFGNYGCKNKENYESYIISEKLNFTLFDVLSANSPYFIKKWKSKKDNTISNIFINILFQMVYSISYLKKCFGLRHFDVHMKNVMLKYVNDSIFNIDDEPIETVYQGKNLKNIKYLLYNIGDNRVVLENTGLIAKLIDFGQSGVIIDKVEILNYGFLDFHSGEEAFSQTNNSDSEFYSMEIVFMLINFYRKFVENIEGNNRVLNLIEFLLEDLIDQENGNKIVKNLKDNIISVHNIESKKIAINTDQRIMVKASVPTGKTVNYPDRQQSIKTYNNYDYKVIPWFMNRRNMAVKSISKPEDYFLKRFIKYLENTNSFNSNTGWITIDEMIPTTPLPNNNTLIFSYDTRVGRENEMIKYYKHFSYYNDVCNETTIKEPNFDALFKNIVDISTADNTLDLLSLSERNQKCLAYKELVVDRYDPAGYIERPLFTHSITKKSKLYNRGELLLDTLKPDRYLLNGAFSYNFIEIDPGTMDIPYFDFSNSQLWSNYLKPNKNLIGTPVWNVRVHLFKKIRDTQIGFNIRESLWNVAKNSLTDGIFVNGGFFIVDKNIKNPLGLTVQFLEPPTDIDIYTPIGFYKDSTGAETVLNVPFGYEKDFGAIVVKNNNLKIMKYTEFMDYHETDDSLQLIQFDDGRTVKVQSQIIRVEGGKPVTKSQKFSYDLAFVSGPILIWDGDVVFNRNKLYSNLEYNRKRYKLLPQAKNFRKFYASETEKDFIYGQRHSNVYMNHNVLAEDFEGNIMIFLIEGRGYDAPGLTRLQLTYLLTEFGVKNAVSLDGGFSAQAIVKEEGELEFALHDPEKRKLGISLAFTIKK